MAGRGVVTTVTWPLVALHFRPLTFESQDSVLPVFPLLLEITPLPVFLDEQDEDCDNQGVNSDGFRERQPQNHVLLNRTCRLGVSSQGLHGLSREQTNADSGTQRTKTNGQRRTQWLQVDYFFQLISPGNFDLCVGGKSRQFCMPPPRLD